MRSEGNRNETYIMIYASRVKVSKTFASMKETCGHFLLIYEK